MILRRLPFLNGIRAFEAAGRTGSFAAAAAELHLSPAAVSRLVRLLEDRLGVTLFERAANRLRPTPAGAQYQAGLTRLLDSLASLTEEVRATARVQALTIGAGPSFASRWLIPRLPEFQNLAPGVEVRIATGGVGTEFGAEWSCGIRLGDGSWPGLEAERLFDAELTPVCAPAVAAGLGAAAALPVARLLRVSHAPEDWPRWLAAAGVAGLAASGPRFDVYGQALQAAADGVGIAMGITPYIDDDLAAGRLVAPFPLRVSKGAAWWLVHPARRQADPAFAAFRGWITAAAPRLDHGGRRVTRAEVPG